MNQTHKKKQKQSHVDLKKKNQSSPKLTIIITFKLLNVFFFVYLLFRVNLTAIFHSWQSKLNEANTDGCAPGNIGSNGDNNYGCSSVYFPVSFLINHFLVRLTTYLTSFKLSFCDDTLVLTCFNELRSSFMLLLI